MHARTTFYNKANQPWVFRSDSVLTAFRLLQNEFSDLTWQFNGMGWTSNDTTAFGGEEGYFFVEELENDNA